MADRRSGTLPRHRGVAASVAVALRVVETGAEVRLPSAGETVRIGSDPSSTVAIDDRYVSSLHCELQRTRAGLVLRDRTSKNGTYVNGARVHEVALEVGARVSIGATTLEVVGDPADEERGAAAALVGEEAGFRAAVELARRGASSDATILFVGESGTGKELFARLVHEASPRAHGPFVAVNCGAISRGLAEAALFGHERGAFTGADERRHGLFEQAHSGTLFLDEVGELPPDQQRTLLRILETRSLRRVGAEKERRVDVRIVAATNKNLGDAERFRHDLYHRLATIEIRLPPLRERRGDIPLLARRFLAERGRAEALDDGLLERLVARPWTGNVRELRNVIERYVILGPSALEELPPYQPALPAAPPPAATSIDDLVRDAFARHASIRLAASSIKMARSTFHGKVKKLGLRRG